jgi:pyrroloquinoline quinone biosynthesis protein D
MSDATVPARPALAPGVRLFYDRKRSLWVLLCPERVIEADGPAHEVLSRCDGRRTVQQIIDELAAIYAADRDVIARDVMEMLADLASKRLLVP